MNLINYSNTQLSEYSDHIRQQSNKIIEYVLDRRERVLELEIEFSTWFVFATPPQGKEKIIHNMQVRASSASFREDITKLIRFGYLPLGIVEMESGLGDAFLDPIPEIYLQDVVSFAKVEFQRAYDAVAKELSAIETSPMSYYAIV